MARRKCTAWHSLQRLQPLFFVGLMVFACLAKPAEAQEEDSTLSVETNIDNAFFTIGDKVTYELKIRHPASFHVTNIDTSETLQDFEAKEEKPFYEQDGETVTEGKRTIITSFQLGEYIMAPAKITYTDAKGESKETLSNKLFVSVESIDKNNQPDLDIKSVKGVLGFRSPFWRWFFIVFLLLIASGAGLWFWLQRRNAATLEDQTPLLSPAEEAYRALHQLFDSDILRREQYKTYFSRLSDIIRRYLERKTGMLALESTTAEVLKNLTSYSAVHSVRDHIEQTLELCDLVKFAKYKPAPDEVLKTNRQAQGIVDTIESETNKELARSADATFQKS